MYIAQDSFEMSKTMEHSYILWNHFVGIGEEACVYIKPIEIHLFSIEYHLFTLMQNILLNE